MKFQLKLDRSEQEVADPLGYKQQVTEGTASAKRKRDMKSLKAQKASEISNRPLQGMIQTFLMLFLSGSGLNIFSIMFTCMAMWTPLKTFYNFRSAFAPYEEEGISLFVPKVKYLGLNMVTLLAGVYKFSVMGLLPVNAEDWISFVEVSAPVEEAYGVLLT